MKRKRLKTFSLILLLLVLVGIVPATVYAENTDIGGGSGGGTGSAKPSEEGGINSYNSGIMFSVVDKNGNRLPGTTSYIVRQTGGSTNFYDYKTLNRLMDKKEVRENVSYVTNPSNWAKWNQTINNPVVELKEFVWSSINSQYGNGGYVSSWLLNNTYDNQKLWEYYARRCGYDYDNYSYDEIQNHYLVFEPMTAFIIGNGAGSYAGWYFMTEEQASRYMQAARKKSTKAVSKIEVAPKRHMSLAIYMPQGTAGFEAATSTANGSTRNYNELNTNKGYGIGSINIAKTCDDAGMDCGKPQCKIEFNSHFPIDPNTGKVMSVIIKDKNQDNAQAVADGTENSVNCCNYLLIEEFGNDKEKLCTERPECCYDCNLKVTDEDNLNSCTTNNTGIFKSPATDDINTWYCMKAFDQYSPYVKKVINQYARIVCREDLTASFPSKLKAMQSVGTYMVWPTSSKNRENNYSLEFKGTMTCKLSIDKAEIEASGNANNIYNDIYNKVLNYVNNGNCSDGITCEAKNWYKLNNNINLTISYNDDEYGGTRVSLNTDISNSNVVLFNPNRNENGYNRLNGISIQINNSKTYKLSEDTYKKLTTSGSGSSNLSNMFDEINKNQFVIPKFDYGILPISYKAKISRNISNTNINYYQLTLSYENIGDNGKFAKGEHLYTCPYEVTYAPPTNTNDNDDGDDSHDDNNDSYEKEDECVCPKGTAHCNMDLRGYLIKNPGMTCRQAQEIYCNADRGNMNVEYRVISLVEAFPGREGISMTAGGRDIGVNWRDSIEKTKAGSVVSTYILNNRKVTGYEVYNLEPLYVIELDSATIKSIRDYNKNNSYADFTLTCLDEENGKGCWSNYLRNSNLIKSGTCKGATTKDKFYSCADKDLVL